MTANTQENQVQDQQLSNKELNFRALENKYQQQLAAQQAENQRLQQELQQRQRPIHEEDDDDSSEPYVDHKRLRKEQARFGQQLKQETQTEIQKAVEMALRQERQDNWLKTNPDFNNVMQHAEKFAELDPELAETILSMPAGFERQKLVYKNIKALGLHKEKAPEPTIQDKIDANRRSPYYQPSGVGTSPYSTVGDFSPVGQKNAHDKMQELKNRLRL